MSKRKTWRTIIVDGVEYTWMMGKQTVVIRKDGDVIGKPQLTDIVNDPWHVIEHDQHKQNFHVTPKHIAQWIGEQL